MDATGGYCIQFWRIWRVFEFFLKKHADIWINHVGYASDVNACTKSFLKLLGFHFSLLGFHFSPSPSLPPRPHKHTHWIAFSLFLLIGGACIYNLSNQRKAHFHLYCLAGVVKDKQTIWRLSIISDFFRAIVNFIRIFFDTLFSVSNQSHGLLFILLHVISRFEKTESNPCTWTF